MAKVCDRCEAKVPAETLIEVRDATSGWKDSADLCFPCADAYRKMVENFLDPPAIPKNLDPAETVTPRDEVPGPHDGE